MLGAVLILGFVIGMQHAFEADHLAAVSTLVGRKQGIREMARHGAIWGLGHAVALGAICGVVVLSSWRLPAMFAPALEAGVGLLLVVLGGHLMYRLWRDRVHVHFHEHDGGPVHLHAHSHRGEVVGHAESAHDHTHDRRRWTTLLVGLTHGAAGSAALTVYVAASLESVPAALAYVAVFGAGSIVGMVMLTAVIALPLGVAAKSLTWAHRSLLAAVGLATVAIGMRLAVANGALLWWA